MSSSYFKVSLILARGPRWCIYLDVFKYFVQIIIRCRRHLIFQIINSIRSNCFSQNINGLRHKVTTIIGIRKQSLQSSYSKICKNPIGLEI